MLIVGICNNDVGENAINELQTAQQKAFHLHSSFSSREMLIVDRVIAKIPRNVPPILA